jgi:acetoin utilization deacetylase AcuC-like enzyme
LIRIRRVADDALASDAALIMAAQDLLQGRFAAAPPKELADLAGRLRDPFDDHFRTLLYVAESARGKLRGCALVSHDPVAKFFLLDWLAAAPGETGGVGGALYGRLRDDAAALGCVGVFFECLPDDPGDVSDPALLAENARRLKFYERLGARPIVGTAYRDPVKPGDTDMPWLVYGAADPNQPLSAEALRAVARAILERKYGWLCPPEYVARVVDSIRDPVRLRSPRYDRAERPLKFTVPEAERIALVVHEGHALHHVRERGYVEAPARVDRVLAVLEPSGLFRRSEPERFELAPILAIHDPAYVAWFQEVCAGMPEGKRTYPYVFPVRNGARLPEDLPTRAGYYCIDTFTPLHREAFTVARGAVDTALSAAARLHAGAKLAYALVRPPGHHAERALYGGFCYFNNAAIAAQNLRDRGATRVAILDVDYHHGNGQQQVFAARPDVLTVSIHGDPTFAYPYFSGFADEIGEGAGEGFNLNLPLPERVDGAAWLAALELALARIRDFQPDALVIALGLDTAAGDPTGTWSLREADLHENGRRIGALGLPTLAVQEGGYGLRPLGRNALAFLSGLAGR